MHDSGQAIKYTRQRGDVPVDTEGIILGIWPDGYILAEFPTWIRNGVDRWVVTPSDVEII